MQATQPKLSAAPYAFWDNEAHQEDLFETSSSEGSTPNESPKIIRFISVSSGQSSSDSSEQFSKTTDEVSRVSIQELERQRDKYKNNSEIYKEIADTHESKIKELKSMLKEKEAEINDVISSIPLLIERAKEKTSNEVDSQYFAEAQGRAEERRVEKTWMDWYRKLSWTAVGIAIFAGVVAIGAIALQVFKG